MSLSQRGRAQAQSMNRTSVHICLAACALTVGTAQGQMSNPVIRVTSRLVEVSVVVHDKKGEPVSDLTQDDFVLYDKGEEQKIRQFAVNSENTKPEDVPAMAEGVVSNRFVTVRVNDKLQMVRLPDSLTVILIDGLNTRFPDQAQAKAALSKFIRRFHSGDQVAIYTLSNELRVLHDFTSDTASLLAAIDRQQALNSPALAASSYADSHIGGTQAAELDELIDRGNAQVAALNEGRRAEITMVALRAIAQRLAGLPGRKNLVWLSGGFPIPSGFIGGDISKKASQATWEAQSTRRIFNDAGISIYPVDARGMVGTAAWMPTTDTAVASILHMGQTPMDARAEGGVDASREVMNQLADQTGGRACLGSNDLGGCIGRAMDDGRGTYRLFFTPSHADWNGEFRELRIKLNRPGLEARYRKGYYALADPPKDPNSRQTALADAATSPVPATGMTILARVLQESTPETPTTALLVVLDGHEMGFTRNARGEQEATVDMEMLAYGDKPLPMTSSHRTVGLSLSAEEFNILMKGGVRVTVNVKTPARSQRIRVVARDSASGRVGSLDVPLKH